MGAVGIVDPAVARTHEEVGLREPSHRTTGIRTIIAKTWKVCPSTFLTQQGISAVWPSHGSMSGFRYTASLVWPSGNFSSAPTGSQYS